MTKSTGDEITMSNEKYLWYPNVVLQQHKILNAIDFRTQPDSIREVIVALEIVLSEMKKIYDRYRREGKYNED